MANRFLEPSETGLRKPTDPNQVNGQYYNQPRYNDFGGLSGPRKVSAKNPFQIVKPGGRR